MGLEGLTTINVELTSRCNKKCWMCGRRKVERDYPELTLEYGDMDFDLVARISRSLPPNIVVQLHKDGEALLYPRLGEAVRLFKRQITNVVTNGKLICAKADEIIGNLDTMAISVIENDDEADEQLATIREFLRMKGDRAPNTCLRLNGDVDRARYEELGVLLVPRVLHSPMGSFDYRKRDPTKPEIAICLDFLNHPCISRSGEVSICVRFDPRRLGVLGNLDEHSLDELWHSEKRREWLDCHIRGRRDTVPLCSYCEYWGVPTAPAQMTQAVLAREHVSEGRRDE